MNDTQGAAPETAPDAAPGTARDSRQQLWSSVAAAGLALWMIGAGAASLLQPAGPKRLIALSCAALSFGGLLCWRDPAQLWQAAPYLSASALLVASQLGGHPLAGAGTLWAAALSGGLGASAVIRSLRERRRPAQGPEAQQNHPESERPPGL